MGSQIKKIIRAKSRNSEATVLDGGSASVKQVQSKNTVAGAAYAHAAASGFLSKAFRTEMVSSAAPSWTSQARGAGSETASAAASISSKPEAVHGAYYHHLC